MSSSKKLTCKGLGGACMESTCYYAILDFHVELQTIKAIKVAQITDLRLSFWYPGCHRRALPAD
jgi:hypothetical protein